MKIAVCRVSIADGLSASFGKTVFAYIRKVARKWNDRFLLLFSALSVSRNFRKWETITYINLLVFVFSNRMQRKGGSRIFQRKYLLFLWL